MSDTRLLHYLFDLAQDPLRARAFRADPDRALADVDLSEEQRDAMRSRDPSRIRAALVERSADQDLLLLAWLGAVTEEIDVV